MNRRKSDVPKATVFSRLACVAVDARLVSAYTGMLLLPGCTDAANFRRMDGYYTTMKLIYCCHCQDVVKLLHHERHCNCGRCGGHYINQLDAVYWGDTAVPLGFDNPSLARAMEAQPAHRGPGKRFEAFVIPKSCPTMTKIDHVNKIRQTDDSD